MDGLQESTVHPSPSSQTRGVPGRQAPPWQTSEPLHTSPSEQDVPSGRLACEHPLAGSKLLLVDGSKPDARRIVLEARFGAGAPMENPSFAGSTLRVYGTTANDGDTGVIQLTPAKWHPLGHPPGHTGYRYVDPRGSAGGVVSCLACHRLHNYARTYDRSAVEGRGDRRI